METKSFQVNGTHISTDNYSIKISCEAQGELLKVIEDPSQRIQTDMAFTTGVLATVPHSILLHVFRLNTERLAFGLYIHFPQDERAIVNVMSPIVVWKEELRPSDDIRLDAALRRDVAASLYPSSQPVDCLLPGYEYFQFNGWNELIISLTFNFTVSKRAFPSLEESEETSMTNQSTAELLGYLDTKSLFQCPDLSDMIIKCSGEEFQVHRIILAGKSDVFAAMLRLPVKESKEGCLVVNDIDPIVFKELLRFIYTGQIEVTDECRADVLMQLYKAADKYDVKDLIQYCEKRMINTVTVDNVMEMYDLTTSRPNSPLAKKARQVIAWNKATFAGNVENFKNFSSKYPELMFEMFHL